MAAEGGTRAAEAAAFRRWTRRLPDGLVLLGGDGEVLALNPAARHRLAQDPTGSSLGAMLDDEEQAGRLLRRWRRSGAPVPCRLRLPGAQQPVSGSAWAESGDDGERVVLRLPQDGGVAARMSAVEDALARRDADAAAQQLRRARDAAEREAALRARVAATVTHEVRTPPERRPRALAAAAGGGPGPRAALAR